MAAHIIQKVYKLEQFAVILINNFALKKNASKIYSLETIISNSFYIVFDNKNDIKHIICIINCFALLFLLLSIFYLPPLWSSSLDF